MKFGVVYPQTEYSNDPTAIRDYAQTAEGLGFNHVVAYDHILGANPDRPGGWSGPYTYQDAFQEPLVLFSFMAGITHRLEFTTGVIILPQRQTATFAKQSATLDVLSGGRTRIGVGLGWNEIEYTALGQDFHTRGRRIEEQVKVLRLLWTQPLVQFQGRWENILDAGLNPLPVQQPIPIWFGGHAEAALSRAARIGDGWLPSYRTADDAQAALDFLNLSLEKVGRSRADFGVEARLPYGNGNPDIWLKTLRGWEAAGIDYLDINTMGAGFSDPSEHLAALEFYAHTVGLV